MRRHPGSLRTLAVLPGIVAIGAIARVSTLDVQSFGHDELYTVWLLRMGLVEMLSAGIAATESTPYLYYMLAWAWSENFGSGEVGLRLFSAVAGTAMIPVSWLIGRALVSDLVGLVTAALVAVNPMLIWYAQEARSYALFGLLAAVSFLAFVETLDRPTKGRSLAWAAASAASLTTHYFAVFLVAAEALVLLCRPHTRRLTLGTIGVPAVAAVVVLPLALEQHAQGSPTAVASSAAAFLRLAQIPKNFLTGFSNPAEVPAAIAAAGLAAVALGLLATRADLRAQRRAGLAAGIAVGVIGVPVALFAVGADYVASRNLLPALVPLVAVLAVGFATSRNGLTAAAGLCVLSLLIVIAVALDPASQRPDFRGAATAVDDSDAPRAIVVSPAIDPEVWAYLKGGTRLPARGATLSEIAVVAMPSIGRYGAGRPVPPRPVVPPAAPPGFRVVEFRQTDAFTLARYQAARPRFVTPGQLARLAFRGSDEPGFLLQTVLTADARS